MKIEPIKDFIVATGEDFAASYGFSKAICCGFGLAETAQDQSDVNFGNKITQTVGKVVYESVSIMVGTGGAVAGTLVRVGKAMQMTGRAGSRISKS